MSSNNLISNGIRISIFTLQINKIQSIARAILNVVHKRIASK